MRKDIFLIIQEERDEEYWRRDEMNESIFAICDTKEEAIAIIKKERRNSFIGTHEKPWVPTNLLKIRRIWVGKRTSLKKVKINGWVS